LTVWLKTRNTNLQKGAYKKNSDSSRNSETVKGQKQDKKLTHQVLKLGQIKMWERKKCQKVMKLKFTRIILRYPNYLHQQVTI